MIEHILVTTDFSEEAEEAFRIAKELATGAGRTPAKITLLSVIEDFAKKGSQFNLALALLESHGIREELRKEAENKIEETKRTQFSGIETDTQIIRATGPIHLEIVKFAKANNIDLIVIATLGRSGISQVLMGSVTEKVVRHSEVPVLVVPVNKSS